MNNEVITIGFRFIVLVMAQVLIFNHIDLFGYINPYIYLLFVIMYPIRKEGRAAFLITSFLLGLTIDLFSDSGGVNAAAMICIAYLRPVFLKFAFGNNYEFQSIRISQTPTGQRLVYITLLIATHHLILFSLEIFSFSHILSILRKTLLSGVFTLFLSLLAIPLFRKKKI
ncbi:rod shape-determining protein MreD [Ascidiimonas aurantiaca]|uniref:rod shape-determining protein MreD n=1 Tax=Ascidiimonas aurantiaca TaxID=1685432 RepID=UPI0030EDAB58